MNNPLPTEYHAGCEARLNELLQSDITNLTEFAERTLAGQGLNPAAGEDVTQRSLALILQGLESDQNGRVPRLMDTENKDAFLNYLRGVISSVIEAMGRKREFRIEHKQWRDEVDLSDDRTNLTPAQIAEWNDLRDQLFQRLRERAPRSLTGIVNAWEPVFVESDRIPAHGHPRNVGKVKKLAKKIVTELGGIR
jgi:hypothetical protein